MCGLTGFYASQNDRPRAELHTLGGTMAQTLSHRGPDAGGVWQDPEHEIVLAHRRLAIIDLSAEGAQPMLSASERYVIVYNGEFYNYRDLQGELEDAGVTFRGQSDTEVFLAAVDQWGFERALHKAGGMFAFALWDRKLRRLHFARDRLGKKPLYIGWAGGSLVFGSELKALRAHPDFRPALDRRALSLYMRYGWLNAPFCIYKGVWALRPGHSMTLDTAALEPGSDLSARMEPYWRPIDIALGGQAAARQRPETEAIDEFEALLRTCVADRMISDVPLGAFLSGGIDSSAVVALMQAVSNRPVKTYTIGFDQKDFDEAAHAARVAAHLGTDHHTLRLDGKEALEVIPRLPDIYDEPFADISAIPTFLVSRFARGEVTVALSGDGGDEMLGGYERHLRAPGIHEWMKRTPRFLRHGLAAALRAIPAERLDALRPGHPQFGVKVRKAAEMLGLETQEDIYARLISVRDSPLLAGWQGAPDLLKTLADLPGNLPGGLGFAEKMMLWDMLGYLPGDILTKVDRASMAASLEARAPLLDTRIFEYAWSLPESFRIRRGGKRGPEGKWLLRQVLARHVPPEMFERPKQGFSMPVGEWLRGPLREWAESLLDEKDLAGQGLLDARAVRRLWRAHLEGRDGGENALWTVLMFRAWHERWL